MHVKIPTKKENVVKIGYIKDRLSSIILPDTDSTTIESLKNHPP